MPGARPPSSTVVPDACAVALPDEVSDEVGACLGIPGIIAHRAVFADGPVEGTTVLVQGVLGAVGSLAAQLARWRGATVIGTVRRSKDVERATRGGVAHVVPLDTPDALDRIRSIAPDGVDRIIEVSLSDNVDLDLATLRVGGVIAAYASREERTSVPFWPLLFNNTSIRLLGSDDFPAAAKEAAVADLTAATREGAMSVAIAEAMPLDAIAAAHDLVDRGSEGRVLLSIG